MSDDRLTGGACSAHNSMMNRPSACWTMRATNQWCYWRQKTRTPSPRYAKPTKDCWKKASPYCDPKNATSNIVRDWCPPWVCPNRLVLILTTPDWSSRPPQWLRTHWHWSDGWKRYHTRRWMMHRLAASIFFRESIFICCFVMTSENLLVLFVSFSCACLVLSIYKLNRPAEGWKTGW